jgi:hypothetical protein
MLRGLVLLAERVVSGGAGSERWGRGMRGGEGGLGAVVMRVEVTDRFVSFVRVPPTVEQQPG